MSTTSANRLGEMSPWIRRATLAALLFLPPAVVLGDDTDIGITTPVVEKNQYDSAGQLTGKELGALIERTVGAGNYELATVLLNTCSSGAGVNRIAGEISGSKNVITTCGANQTTALDFDVKTNKLGGFFGGFFDSVIADPKKSVDANTEDAKKANPRTPKTPEDEQRLKDRYEAARKSALAKGRDPKQWPEWEKGGRDLKVEEPQNAQSADKPGAKKLGSGTNSNHAIIYVAYTGENTDRAIDKAKKGLQAAGFDSVTVLTPLTKADYSKMDEQQKNGQDFSVPSDRATPANLEKALKDLQPKLNNKEHLAVVMVSHGGVVHHSNATNASSGVGAGSVFTQASHVDHIGDAFTSTLLAEEAFSASLGYTPNNFELLSRWAQPKLLIQTADEANISDALVSVSINGLELGDIDIGAGGSGFYSLELSDYFIDRLINETDLSQGLDVDFGFNDPRDHFRLATLADIDTYGSPFGHYGLSMGFYVEASEVVEPGTLFLVSIGGALALLARRRIRHAYA